ncbi:HIT family protein [Micromonospora sp. NPDC000668]|uniref:HIT family protein n=1 Tax=Micromonospora sp. NPDC000668 TaxID=3364219 RepID=UPI0036C5FD03
MNLPGNELAQPEDCLFCAIVRGELEASLVHQDDEIIAFMDLHPVTPGHLLVVPRLHAVGLEDLPEDVGGRMWTQAHRLARALRRSTLRCEGVNMFLADGKAAFQEIFHVHLHVFPRFAGDTFRIDADWRRRERVELETTAVAVREGMTAAQVAARPSPGHPPSAGV